MAFTDAPLLNLPDPPSTATYFHFFPSISSKQTTLDPSASGTSPKSLPGRNLSSTAFDWSGGVVGGGIDIGGAEARVVAAATRMVSRTSIRASCEAGSAIVCDDAGEFLNRIGAIEEEEEEEAGNGGRGVWNL